MSGGVWWCLEHVWWCLVVSGACLAVLMYRGWFDLSWCIWVDIISSAKNWCTDAADTLMLLNQYHDQLADLSIAFFSQINLCHLDQNCAAQTKLFWQISSRCCFVLWRYFPFHFWRSAIEICFDSICSTNVNQQQNLQIREYICSATTPMTVWLWQLNNFNVLPDKIPTGKKRSKCVTLCNQASLSWGSFSEKWGLFLRLDQLIICWLLASSEALCSSLFFPVENQRMIIFCTSSQHNLFATLLYFLRAFFGSLQSCFGEI